VTLMKASFAGSVIGVLLIASRGDHEYRACRFGYVPGARCRVCQHRPARAILTGISALVTEASGPDAYLLLSSRRSSARLAAALGLRS
jgi:hypothetical protein